MNPARPPQVDVECRWPAPPARPELAGGHVHLWCAGLDVPEATLQRLAASLSPDERDRADRFREGPLRNRFVAGRAILRSILAHYLAAGEENPLFAYGERGKPRLAEPWASSGLRFNLSHSHGLALIAVAVGRNVGVNVERLRPVGRVEGLVVRCFSAEERRRVGGAAGRGPVAGLLSRLDLQRGVVEGHGSRAFVSHGSGERLARSAPAAAVVHLRRRGGGPALADRVPGAGRRMRRRLGRPGRTAANRPMALGA